MQLVINAGGVSGQLATWNLNRNFQSLVNKANDVIKSFKIVKDATYSLRGGVRQLQPAINSIDARIRQEQEKKAKIIDFHNTVIGFLNLAEETDRRVASYFSSSTKSASAAKSVIVTAKKKSWREMAWDGCCNFGKKVREKVIEGAKWVEEKVSDAWDGTKSAVKKAWNWAKDFYNKNKKVINKVIQTVVIVVVAAITIAGVIASCGALAGVLAGFGIAASVASAIASTVVGIAIVSTAVAATLNVVDAWLEIDNSVFNTIQNVANWTSAISTFICDVAGIVKAVKDIFVRRAAKKAAASLADDVVRALPDTPPAGMADDISKLVPDSAPNGVADDISKLVPDSSPGEVTDDVMKLLDDADTVSNNAFNNFDVSSESTGKYFVGDDGLIKFKDSNGMTVTQLNKSPSASGTNKYSNTVLFEGDMAVGNNTVTIKRKVYQYDSGIDLNYRRPDGLTNYEAMLDGKSPIVRIQTPDGIVETKLELHHLIQQETLHMPDAPFSQGTLVEIPSVTHKKFDKQLHIQYPKQDGIRTSFRWDKNMDHTFSRSFDDKQYNAFREVYWRTRALMMSG